MSVQIISAIYNYNECGMDPPLSAPETAVLLALAYCCGPAGQIHPSMNLLCQRTRLERNTIKRVVGRLTQIGLITVTPRYREDGSQTTSAYQITLPEDAYDLRMGRAWAKSARDQEASRSASGGREAPRNAALSDSVEPQCEIAPPPVRNRTPPLPNSPCPPSQNRTPPRCEIAPPGNVKRNVRETTTTTTPTGSVARPGGGGLVSTFGSVGEPEPLEAEAHPDLSSHAAPTAQPAPVLCATRRLPVMETSTGEWRIALPGTSPEAARWDWDEIARSLEGDRARHAQSVADALRAADADPICAHWRTELLAQMYRVRPKEPGKWAAGVVQNWRAGCGTPPAPAAPETGPDPCSWEYYREALRLDRERFAPVVNTGPTPDQLAFVAMFSRPIAAMGATP